jgi:F0F1-type ATP synthase assembly protein I
MIAGKTMEDVLLLVTSTLCGSAIGWLLDFTAKSAKHPPKMILQ